MKDMIGLGRVTAPVGIKGEVRVYPYTDEQARFSAVEKVYLGERALRIEKVRYQKDMVVLKLEGVDNRNAAEALRNAELSLPREEMYEMDEDSYLVDDLIGIRAVLEDGTPVGVLKSVLPNPAHDLYEIEKPDGSSFLLPAVKAFIVSVDTGAGIMTVRLIEGLG